LPDPFQAVLEHRHPGEQSLWRAEGVQTTVSVNKVSESLRALYLDGLHQASDSPREVMTHRHIGHLAMLLHPQPKDALVIGLGGGVTPGAVSRHPGVSVDVVELSDTVAQAAVWFSHVNNDVVNQPNVRLRIDDGRNYLLLTPKRYDVITADIIRPFHAGAGNVYSVEYFRLARNALKDDGLMLQWLPRRSDVQYKLIMRTFLSVFPNSTLWVNGSFIIGSKRPAAIERAVFDQKKQMPRMSEILESLGLSDFDSLMELYTAGPDSMRSFAGEGPILTDDRPLIEYFLSLPAERKRAEFPAER
jgi:spermidine synthase